MVQLTCPTTFLSVFYIRESQPFVYIRCLLQSLIYSDLKILRKMTIKELIFEDLAELVLPADILLEHANFEIEIPDDHRFQIAKRMEAFLNRVEQVCRL